MDDISDLYEQFLAEQALHVFRYMEFEPIGIQCLAQRIARHQERTDVAQLTSVLRQLSLPARLMGAIAVEPGTEGRLYPMIIGVHNPLSIEQMYQLINQPKGTVDADWDELLPPATV